MEQARALLSDDPQAQLNLGPAPVAPRAEMVPAPKAGLFPAAAEPGRTDPSWQPWFRPAGAPPHVGVHRPFPTSDPDADGRRPASGRGIRRFSLATSANPLGLDGWPSFGVDVNADRVSRIDVLDPDVATDTGITVGDEAPRLDSIDGPELRYGDDNSIGQESYVRWVRSGRVDMVFDVLAGPERVTNPGTPVIWRISVQDAADSHYSTYRTDDVAGSC